MSYPPSQKPPQWSMDSGVVAYNASRLGLPMPVALWALWEKGGETTYDLSGNNYHGTLTGTTWKEGGLWFSEGSATDHVNCGIIDMSGWDGVTIIAKLRWTVTAQTAEYTVISNWDASGASILFRLEIGGMKPEVYIVTEPNFTLEGNFTDLVLTDGKEHVLIYTYDAAVGADCYLDGTKSTQHVAGAGVLDSDSTGNDLYLGASFHAPTDDYNGLIDLICVFACGLTGSQVQTISNNPYGLIADPYQIETLAYVAAVGGGLSIPIAMHHLTKNVGS